MNGIEIKLVSSNQEKHIFLTFPWQIYRTDPLWVPPLLPELRERMDPKHGVFFNHGSAEFFIAWRDGKPVGTICAAEDRTMNQELGHQECIFGFFQFAQDYNIFLALIETARKWASKEGFLP
jgi:hypothetical protein